jgi:hypothetical protein
LGCRSHSQPVVELTELSCSTVRNAIDRCRSGGLMVIKPQQRDKRSVPVAAAAV